MATFACLCRFEVEWHPTRLLVRHRSARVVVPPPRRPRRSRPWPPVRWYCCLGTGEIPSSTGGEKVVANFTPRTPIHLTLGSSYHNARDPWHRLTSCNPPDVLDFRFRRDGAFHEQWCISPLPPKRVRISIRPGREVYNFGDRPIGIPFALYPSSSITARLFAESTSRSPPMPTPPVQMPDCRGGLELRPRQEECEDLTVDSSGKDSTRRLRPKKIVHYGFERRWTTRGRGRLFRGRSFQVADARPISRRVGAAEVALRRLLTTTIATRPVLERRRSAPQSGLGGRSRYDQLPRRPSPRDAARRGTSGTASYNGKGHWRVQADLPDPQATSTPTERHRPDLICSGASAASLLSTAACGPSADQTLSSRASTQVPPRSPTGRRQGRRPVR